jgi:outer membrane protein TolC
VTPEMDRADEALREARANYDSAEHNLAVARATLNQAEREFHASWGKALANPAKTSRLSSDQ